MRLVNVRHVRRQWPSTAPLNGYDWLIRSFRWIRPRNELRAVEFNGAFSLNSAANGRTIGRKLVDGTRRAAVDGSNSIWHCLLEQRRRKFTDRMALRATSATGCCQLFLLHWQLWFLRFCSSTFTMIWIRVVSSEISVGKFPEIYSNLSGNCPVWTPAL